MTTDRAYRTAMSEPEALAELRRCAGTQFDPRVVAALQAFVGTSRPEATQIDIMDVARV
jgi:HD-GYP domain-containing protein (c-di-GMP phosphodiesterase class II)